MFVCEIHEHFFRERSTGSPNTIIVLKNFHTYLNTRTHAHTHRHTKTRSHLRTHASETLDFLVLTIYKGTHFHITNNLDTNHVFVCDLE